MAFVDEAALIAAFSISTLSGCKIDCVARGTRVLTPRGYRAVEDLAIGDTIISVDPLTGALGETRLCALRTAKHECLALRFAGRELLCTSDHPLYSPERKAFVEAGAWVTEGLTRLLVHDDGRLLVRATESVAAYVGMHEVFDLTVADDPHTFVANGIVVHNKSYAREYCGYSDPLIVTPGEGTIEVRLMVCDDEGEPSVMIRDAYGVHVTLYDPITGAELDGPAIQPESCEDGIVAVIQAPERDAVKITAIGGEDSEECELWWESE